MKRTEYTDILSARPFYLNEIQTKRVTDILDGMDTEDKISQVICLEVRAAGEPMNIDAGAVMCLPGDFDSLYDCIEELQRKADIPLLIGGNLEEGADVIREGTNIGNLMQIGASRDQHDAELLGCITGKEASSTGMNWAFAPVTDIPFTWRNPVIATRVFGVDPDFTADASVRFIEALQSKGVASTVKHFPGDGVDERDQHFHPSINDLSQEEWEQSFGMVYRRCIEADAKTFMVGHIIQPSLARAVDPEIKDKDILPASTSKELVTGILRGRLGFNGMISTDSTNMSGFDQMLPREVAIPTAIEAGCDMLLFVKDEYQDKDFLRKGLEKGILSQERLNEAVLRILGLKASLGLLETDYKLPDKDDARRMLGNKDAVSAAESLADRSITLVKDLDGMLPVTPEKYRRIYLVPFVEGRGFGSNRDEFAGHLKDLLEKEGFTVEVHPEDRSQSILALNGDRLREKTDLIMYAANLNSISNKAVTRLEWGTSMGKTPCHIHEVPTVFISFGNPYHLADVPRVRTMINAYKFNRVTAACLIDKLSGRTEFKGKSPVDPFCGFWDARL